MATRRESGTKPYIGGPYADGVQVPEFEDLGLAAQIARGLSVDKWSSPRAIKRFLNAWGVRVSIAGARGADLDLGVTLKLYILEDRFPKSFAVLVEAQPEERGPLLDTWEAWAKAEPSDAQNPKPESVDEETRAWASMAPGLASVAGKIDSYLNVAATFTSASAGEGLSSDTLRLMDDLLDASEPIRRAAVDEVIALPLDERETVITRLLQRAGAVDAAIAIESAAEVAKSDALLAPTFHSAVQTHALRHVVPASVVDIASVSNAEATLKQLVSEPGVESDVREFASQELADLGGPDA